MRVGVLEWICGGGHIDADDSEMVSLRSEGWAMLHSAVMQLDRSGIPSIVAMDRKRISQKRIDQLPARCQVVTHGGEPGQFPSSWREIAQLSEQLILVAPEFSGILQNAVQQLSVYSSGLCNCQGEFLASSCDKWRTAKCFTESRIDCPPTQLLDQVSAEWLDQHSAPEGRWIIKPRDGAGCYAIEIVSQVDLLARLSSLSNARSTDNQSVRVAVEQLSCNLILQPYISGPSYSRSAIVDSKGVAYWLPLVTQRFTVGGGMRYLGGEVLIEQDGCYVDPAVERRYAIADLDQLLDRAIQSLGQGCLGWVGFDLVYSTLQNRWIVIETNPRLTTSFVGLSEAINESLMEQILRACRGRSVQLSFTNKAVRFLAEGSSKTQ